MISTMNKQAYVVQRNYPFLDNFPFPEFKIELAEAFVHNGPEDDLATSRTVADPRLLKFIYNTKAGGSMSIVIFRQELNWLNEVSDKITNLDEALKTINEAIDAPDLISKRNGLLYSEEWCSQLKDNKSKLSYSTSGEILASLIDDQTQFVGIINKLVKLTLNKGLVGLSAREYQIILTYYQYQLIYAKLILGIVISSKISF